MIKWIQFQVADFWARRRYLAEEAVRRRPSRAARRADGMAEITAPFAAPARTSDVPMPDAPGDVVLLTRLLRLATLDPDPAPLAAHVVTRFGSYARVLAASPQELMAVKGLKQHGAAAIKLMQEAALRLLRDAAARAPVLDEWESVLAYLRGVVAWERVEQFRILFLDERGVLLADEAQARGTVNHTPVYPREVARRALELGAAGLILVHNHPSGDPTPSEPDIDMTEQVCAAVELFDVRVLDHVIIGNGRWTSFRAAGLLAE
jgi:DNA repair protein RadC